MQQVPKVLAPPFAHTRALCSLFLWEVCLVGHPSIDLPWELECMEHGILPRAVETRKLVWSSHSTISRTLHDICERNDHAWFIIYYWRYFYNYTFVLATFLSFSCSINVSSSCYKRFLNVIYIEFTVNALE